MDQGDSKLEINNNSIMNKYKVLKDLAIDGQDYVVDNVVELSEKDAASFVDGGFLVLTDEKDEVTPSRLKPTPEALATIKSDAADAKEAGEPAERVSNEERNFNTGANIVGVNSPDPSVGAIVPVDIVMPGQVVDPKTGKVLEGAGSDLSTPQPLAPTVLQSKDKVRADTKRQRITSNANYSAPVAPVVPVK
jgi:hypothetical protein